MTRTTKRVAIVIAIGAVGVGAWVLYDRRRRAEAAPGVVSRPGVQSAVLNASILQAVAPTGVAAHVSVPFRP